MKRLHVASAQITARHADFAHNLDLIHTQAARSAAQGASVLLFSECVMHGGTVAREAVEMALAIDSPECQQIGALAKEHGVTLLVGFMEKDRDRKYNSHLIAHADGRRQVQRKLALNATELANGLTPGPVERVPFECGGFRAAIAICAEWGSEPVQAELDRQGCDVLFLPTAGGGTREGMLPLASLQTEEGANAYIERMKRVAFPFDLVRYCLKKRRAVVTSNCVGDNRFDLFQEGHCVIMDRTGELLGLIPGAPVIEYQRSAQITAIITRN